MLYILKLARSEGSINEFVMSGCFLSNYPQGRAVKQVLDKLLGQRVRKMSTIKRKGEVSRCLTGIRNTGSLSTHLVAAINLSSTGQCAVLFLQEN